MTGKPDGTTGRITSLDYVVLAVAACAIASSAILVRWADASSIALAFWRTLGGSVILLTSTLGVRLRSNQPLDKSGSTGMTRRRTWTLLTISGLALAGHFAAWLASLEMTTVSASVTLAATAPLMIAAWRMVGSERPSALTLFALLAAFAGSALIAFGDLGQSQPGSGAWSQRALVGDGLALIGAATVAIYLVLGESLRTELGTAIYASRVYAIAATALLLATLVARPLGFSVALNGFDQTTWLIIGAMIIGPQILGHTSLNYLLGRIGSLSVGLTLLTEPIIATFLAWVLLAEVPSAPTWLGAPLVIGALVLHLINQQDPSQRDGAA